MSVRAYKIEKTADIETFNVWHDNIFVDLVFRYCRVMGDGSGRLLIYIEKKDLTKIERELKNKKYDKQEAMKMGIKKEEIYCEMCGEIMYLKAVNHSEYMNGGYMLDNGSYPQGFCAPPKQAERIEYRLYCSNDDCNFAKQLPMTMIETEANL